MPIRGFGPPGYGGLDDTGLPTLDAAGERLSKSARKRLGKQLEKHTKMHSAAIGGVADGN